MSQMSRRAQLKQQQEAAEKATRTKRILIAGIVIAGLVVAAVIGIVLMQSLGRDDAPVVLPPNGTEDHGILVQGRAPTDGVPHLVIWEDYRCGGCVGVEAEFGPVVSQLVADGEITAEHRQSYFLDGQARNGQSKRAALAAASADTIGMFDQYHAGLFAHYRAGGDYSEQSLREVVPASIGITGDALATFQEAYDAGTYEGFVDAAQEAFVSQEINSTPTYMVGENRLPLFNEEGTAWALEPTVESLMGAIREAAGQ